MDLSAPRETIKDWENGQELVRFLNQLDIFESCGKKAEIESLESLLNGHLRGNYLTKFYLPLSMDTYIESKASFKIDARSRVGDPPLIGRFSKKDDLIGY